MSSNAVRFPGGRHFALTWGIPDAYGGMTAAMLHRSRAMVRLAGTPVTILTLDDRADTSELEQRLRASGELIEGMRLRNLWDDLRSSAPSPSTRPPVAAAPLAPEPGDDVVELAGVVLLRRRCRDDSTSVDRFRRDGSLLATERLVDGRRRIVVHDATGAAIREFASTWALSRWWLDRLSAGSTSFVIVDSKTAARFVTSYRRDHVITAHIVHGGHRDGDRPGTLRASREYSLRRADEFDALVVLTARQRDELVSDGITTGRPAIVIPNGVELDEVATSGRDAGRGVMLAALTARKRVDHAVGAVAAAARQEPSVTLDVFGEGDRRDEVERRIAAEHAAGAVRLLGHRPGARAEFRSAGFSLLTSTSEGLPLVLVESMAAGCIPIAYDIRYGPSDVIRHGVDGFLVPAGDEAAMTSAILELVRMAPEQQEAMRRRAIERAREFSDVAVTERWSELFAAALDRKRVAGAQGRSLAVRLRRRAGVIKRRLLRVIGR